LVINIQFSRHVLEESSNIKFHKNPACGRRVVPCDEQTDGHGGGQTWRS